jgi:hypothetical protein
MRKSDAYYDALDTELTETTPIINRETEGSLGASCASIVVLSPEDMVIAKALADKTQLSVSDYLSQTLHRQLA